MKSLFWWFALFFATKALAVETYICKYNSENEYICAHLKDEPEEVKEQENEPFHFDIKEI